LVHANRTFPTASRCPCEAPAFIVVWLLGRSASTCCGAAEWVRNRQAVQGCLSSVRKGEPCLYVRNSGDAPATLSHPEFRLSFATGTNQNRTISSCTCQQARIATALVSLSIVAKPRRAMLTRESQPHGTNHSTHCVAWDILALVGSFLRLATAVFRAVRDHHLFATNR
jgi:hypothetical protein